MVWESTATPLMICINASRSSGSGRRSLVIKAIPGGHYLARGNARRKERFISKSFLRDGAHGDEERGLILLARSNMNRVKGCYDRAGPPITVPINNRSPMP